jgi:hypothetical protein
MAFIRSGKFWILLAVLATLQAGGLYIVVQQTLRLAANEPQGSMARDVGRDLSQGKKPSDLAQGYIDMSQNMAPFIIIYDQYGKVVAGNGYLDNQIPQVPIGVLSAAQGQKVNRVSWEPKNNVRIASVSVQGGDYYVLGGRSLENTEHQISSFGKWIIALWGIAIAFIAGVYHLSKPKTKHKIERTDKAD